MIKEKRRPTVLKQTVDLTNYLFETTDARVVEELGEK